MSEQDFSRRLMIVVRKDLPGWQAANTVAHVSAYVGNKLGESFGTGKYFHTSDTVEFPRNAQYPIIIKRANSNEQLQNLHEKVRASGLVHIGFVREMIDYTNDTELQKALERKTAAEVELLGVGVFGPNEEVNTLTKKFGLWE